MKVFQIIKKVNNTELGKGGTHETYVLVPAEVEIMDVFPEVNKELPFNDAVKGTVEKIRLTIGREKRIVGLGNFYRNHDLNAGDEVMLERICTEDGEKYNICVNKKTDSIILRKSRDGFEVLNPERIHKLGVNSVINYKNELKKIALQFVGNFRKRSDSPDETPIYELVIGDETLSNNYKNNDLIEIDINGNNISINKYIAWQKISFDVEE